MRTDEFPFAGIDVEFRHQPMQAVRAMLLEWKASRNPLLLHAANAVVDL